MTEYEIKRIGTKEGFNEVMEKLQLTDRQKQIFVLKYGRGLVNADIAAEINYCRKTVSEEVSIIRHKMSQLK